MTVALCGSSYFEAALERALRLARPDRVVYPAELGADDIVERCHLHGVGYEANWERDDTQAEARRNWKLLDEARPVGLLVALRTMADASPGIADLCSQALARRVPVSLVQLPEGAARPVFTPVVADDLLGLLPIG